MPVRVVKLGGSLLSRSHLMEDFRAWWNEQPPMLTLMMVGGGGLIDVLREWDGLRCGGDQAEVHWRCVEALRYSYLHVADLFSEEFEGAGHSKIDCASEWANFATVQRHFVEDRPPQSARLVLVNVSAIYGRQHSGVLPRSWATTSDAIAMWFAGTIAATECVLLKSCDVSPDAGLAELALAGIVDPVCGELQLARSRWRVEKLSEARTAEHPIQLNEAHVKNATGLRQLRP